MTFKKTAAEMHIAAYNAGLIGQRHPLREIISEAVCTQDSLDGLMRICLQAREMMKGSISEMKRLWKEWASLLPTPSRKEMRPSVSLLQQPRKKHNETNYFRRNQHNPSRDCNPYPFPFIEREP